MNNFNSSQRNIISRHKACVRWSPASSGSAQSRIRCPVCSQVLRYGCLSPPPFPANSWRTCQQPARHDIVKCSNKMWYTQRNPDRMEALKDYRAESVNKGLAEGGRWTENGRRPLHSTSKRVCKLLTWYAMSRRAYCCWILMGGHVYRRKFNHT